MIQNTESILYSCQIRLEIRGGAMQEFASGGGARCVLENWKEKDDA